MSAMPPAPDFLRMALELGAARCMRKPFTPGALLGSSTSVLPSPIAFRRRCTVELTMFAHAMCSSGNICCRGRTGGARAGSLAMQLIGEKSVVQSRSAALVGVYLP
jgi:hypothetical protein